MDVLITGKPGAGKTTVCGKLVNILKESGITCGGVLSPGSHEGFDVVDIKTGKTEAFARFGEVREAVGRFVFDKKGVDFAIKALEDSRDCSVTFIDEIGPLELKDKGLMPAVTSLADSDKILVIIARSWLSEEVRELFPKRTFLTFEVTEANRETLPEKISGILAKGI